MKAVFFLDVLFSIMVISVFFMLCFRTLMSRGSGLLDILKVMS